jgi:hypothetical protein
MLYKVHYLDVHDLEVSQGAENTNDSFHQLDWISFDIISV